MINVAIKDSIKLHSIPEIKDSINSCLIQTSLLTIMGTTSATSGIDAQKPQYYELESA